MLLSRNVQMRYSIFSVYACITAPDKSMAEQRQPHPARWANADRLTKDRQKAMAKKRHKMTA
jgi:hypothetical protein